MEFVKQWESVKEWSLSNRRQTGGVSKTGGWSPSNVESVTQMESAKSSFPTLCNMLIYYVQKILPSTGHTNDTAQPKPDNSVF